MNQIGYIFEFLDFSDVVRLSNVCRQFNIAYIKYLTLKSNTWVLDQVEKYMRDGKIISAERLMRYYICLNDISGSRDNLSKRNKFALDKINIQQNIKHNTTHNIQQNIQHNTQQNTTQNTTENTQQNINNQVISKYISLLCIYIWGRMDIKYQIHQNEIYRSLRSRVHRNIDNFSIYIPINLYHGSIFYNLHEDSPDLSSMIISTNTVYTAKSYQKKNITQKNISQKNITNISQKNTYLISSIFAYICILDRQLILASDIIDIVKNKSENMSKNKSENMSKNMSENKTENKTKNKTKNMSENKTENKTKNKTKNMIYYLVKWQLTQNDKYLKIFEHSDFAFGIYLYGYKLYKTDNGVPMFINMLEKCLKYDPTLIIALNSYINLKNRIDLIIHSIESNPTYIQSYMLNITHLFDVMIWDNNNDILNKINNFMITHINLFNTNQNTLNRDNLEMYFTDIKEIKYSAIFVIIHRVLYNIKMKNNNMFIENLIIQNLILLFRLYFRHNNISGAINILLHIQNNYNTPKHIKNYIYQQIQLISI
jgi:hypothetical protein